MRLSIEQVFLLTVVHGLISGNNDGEEDDEPKNFE